MTIAGVMLLVSAAQAGEIEIALTGAQEVPPVETDAGGQATIAVEADGSIAGRVTTTGVEGIAAHIHAAPAGENGPPIITLVNDGDGRWSVPADAALTAEQQELYQSGSLYINVHSMAFKAGEIRGQLKP